jgi:hypothetical protein
MLRTCSRHPRDKAFRRFTERAHSGPNAPKGPKAAFTSCKEHNTAPYVKACSDRQGLGPCENCSMQTLRLRVS